MTGDVIFDADFTDAAGGSIPEGWRTEVPPPFLAPSFTISSYRGVPALQIEGMGDSDCLGTLCTSARIILGRTYAFSVCFGFDGNLNPHQNLLFQCFHRSTKAGIFEFQREGESSASRRAEKQAGAIAATL